MNDFILADTDTINTDGTVTRLLCPACRAPLHRRIERGFYCPNTAARDKHPEGTTYVPQMVTYAPIVERVALPVAPAQVGPEGVRIMRAVLRQARNSTNVSVPDSHHTHASAIVDAIERR